VKLGTLVASGKPVEVTRYTGTIGQGIMIQLAAETGYVQVQSAELLRMLLNPRTEDVPDPWGLLETAYAALLLHARANSAPITTAFIRHLGEILKARQAALAAPGEGDPHT
jgi:hypothetical protein